MLLVEQRKTAGVETGLLVEREHHPLDEPGEGLHAGELAGQAGKKEQRPVGPGVGIAAYRLVRECNSS
jgi:hypothetical protein